MFAVRHRPRRLAASINEQVIDMLLDRSWYTGRDGSMTFTGGGVNAYDPLTNTITTGQIYTDFQITKKHRIRLYFQAGARTELFLNSDAPATQDVTVATGTVMVFARAGTGYTITTSAGTATGSGFGAVTIGVPQYLTITGGGTITITISGTPSGGRVSVQQAAFPSLYIPTSGSTVVRPVDSNNWNMGANCSTTAGEMTSIAVPYLWSAAPGALPPSGRTHYPLLGASNLYVSRSSNDNVQRTDGGTQSAIAVAKPDYSGMARPVSCYWDAQALKVYRDGSADGYDTSLSPPWTARQYFLLGSTTANQDYNGYCGGVYTAGGATDAERMEFHRAVRALRLSYIA